MQITYLQAENYIRAHTGLNGLNGHVNSYNAKTSLAILRNINALTTLVTEYQTLRNNIINKHGKIVDGVQTLELSHPELIALHELKHDVNVNRLDFNSIDTPNNQISIECLHILHDIMDNANM